MSAPLEKFNQVENALITLLASIPGLGGRVSVGEHVEKPDFPRATIYAERVQVRESTIAGKRMTHYWTFIIVIDHISGDYREGYAKMKELFWQVYEKIMTDRTLGLGGDVFATPAMDSRLERAFAEKGYGFSWWIEVVVRISEL
jgi:hypothetical protein